MVFVCYSTRIGREKRWFHRFSLSIFCKAYRHAASLGPLAGKVKLGDFQRAATVQASAGSCGRGFAAWRSVSLGANQRRLNQFTRL